MCDLICDAISFCAWSYDMGNIDVYDEILIENKTEEKKGIKVILLKSPSKRCFRNGILSFLSRADARMSAVCVCVCVCVCVSVTLSTAILRIRHTIVDWHHRF